MKEGMNIFHVFKYKDYIVVNNYTLKDIISIKIMSLIAMIGISVLLAAFLPVILSLFYLFLVLTDFNNEASRQDRFYTSLIVLISAIYFLLDYHFGWFIWYFLHEAIEPTTFQYIATINLFLGFYHLVLLFLFKEGLPSHSGFVNMLWYLGLIAYVLYFKLDDLYSMVGKLIVMAT